MNPILRALAAKYREYLKPFEGHTQEILDLLVLHPHIASILDSRIVEMGSNANGEYVRWENGLQVCWMNSVQLTFNSARSLTAVWTFPAAFIEAPTVSHHTHDILPSGDAKRSGLLHTAERTTTSVVLEYYDGNGPFVGGDVVNTQPFAIGRWK